MVWVLLALALAPIITIFTFVYIRDKWEREPIWQLGLIWGLGILVCIPVLIQEELGSLILKDIWPDIDPDDESVVPPLIYTFYYAFIVVAFTEELWKYLVVRWAVYWTRRFNEPFDGIMYCVASSLGFAAIENVLYVVEGGVGVGILRMLTSVPGHAMMGVVMGYFMGRAKFKFKGFRAWIERMIGLLLAVAIHGMYDFSLMQKHWDWFALMALVVLIVGIILALRAMKISRGDSPFQGGIPAVTAEQVAQVPPPEVENQPPPSDTGHAAPPEA